MFKGHSPGRGCSLPDLRTPLGCGFHFDTPFPGCVLRTTRGYRLERLRPPLATGLWKLATPFCRPRAPTRRNHELRRASAPGLHGIVPSRQNPVYRQCEGEGGTG
jgi:hypothetical protein